MEKQELTFNDLPQVVAQLRDEVMDNQVRENRHKPMTVEEAAEYTRIPIGTLYMKLGDGTIPATKPGKRYVLYQDELDKWLEANRKNAVPLTADEKNEAILSSHKRKPNKADWHD